MHVHSPTPSLAHRLNPLASDSNFKKSCETVLPKMKRSDKRLLHAILAQDDPQKPYIDDDEHLYIWYLAIGSMINPISIYLRDLTPLISYPARCADYRLVFRDHCGMADIEPCVGGEFHGVVHLLPAEQMMCLDQVEHMYQRKVVAISDYEQRSHLVYVYKMNLIGHAERIKSLPTERYLDIIVKGCEHFGVDSSYINRLKQEQPVIPRKLPTDYRTISNIPDHSYFSMSDLRKHNGSDPTLPLWTCVNGKILEYAGLPSITDADFEHQKRFYDYILSYLAGREIAYVIAKTWYEPMYKVSLHEGDLSDEHRALAEDMCVCWGLNNGGENAGSYWKPIGRLL